MQVTNVEGRDFVNRSNQQAALKVYKCRLYYDGSALRQDVFVNNFGVQIFAVEENSEVALGSTQNIFPAGKTFVLTQSVDPTDETAYRLNLSAPNRVSFPVNSADLDSGGIFVSIEVYQ